MNTKKEETVYFNTEQVKEELKLSESSFRRILSKYKNYIPYTKGLKNSNHFPFSSVQIIKSIKFQREQKYTHTEIIHNLQNNPYILKARMESGDDGKCDEYVDLLDNPDTKSLVRSFVSRIDQKQKQIDRIRKDLDKRTLQYQEEISNLKTEHSDELQDIKNEHQNMKDYISRLEEDMNRMREEQSKSLFKKLLSFLTTPVF